MTEPTGPTDTDRIIEAHREEAPRTRKLLVWIFIGIPAIGALIWFILFVNAANRIDNATNSAPDYSSSDLADASPSSADSPFGDPGAELESVPSDPSDSVDGTDPLTLSTARAGSARRWPRCRPKTSRTCP
jgi:hypothetical protein